MNGALNQLTSCSTDSAVPNLRAIVVLEEKGEEERVVMVVVKGGKLGCD